MRAIVIAASLLLFACSNDPAGTCGDGTCSPGSGESCASCPTDCGMCSDCGNGACDAARGESCASCATDCGTCAGCGDGTCDFVESCDSCPSDCGACPTTCNTANCDGCCDGDACVSGASTGACGSGGAMCTACGPSFLCSAGACIVDPASRWNVVLEHLEVSTTATTGAAWDVGGGAPDPLVRIVVGSETATPVSSGTANDVFAVDYVGGPTATDQRADALQSYLGFFVFDEDLTDYDFIGGCTVTLSPAAFTGGPVTTDCPREASSMQSGYSLSWHLERF